MATTIPVEDNPEIAYDALIKKNACNITIDDAVAIICNDSWIPQNRSNNPERYVDENGVRINDHEKQNDFTRVNPGTTHNILRQDSKNDFLRIILKCSRSKAIKYLKSVTSSPLEAEQVINTLHFSITSNCDVLKQFKILWKLIECDVAKLSDAQKQFISFLAWAKCNGSEFDRDPLFSAIHRGIVEFVENCLKEVGAPPVSAESHRIGTIRLINRIFKSTKKIKFRDADDEGDLWWQFQNVIATMDTFDEETQTKLKYGLAMDLSRFNAYHKTITE
jgi:hypothetical protein